jgi:hypothetical protein
MTPTGMKFIPSFINIRLLFQKLLLATNIWKLVDLHDIVACIQAARQQLGNKQPYNSRG